ncbi:MAG: ATP-binding cassette domain-containing protein [Alphaproteobacteria bacterium]|nr:ATP-binding cassette domain-containing protein [Alphaproteobacteria bacterium]
MSALLEVKNLNVDIPLAAGILHPVQDLTFSVDKGQTLCIVGESGCGKSLTSLALMDLLPKKAVRTGTSILFDGEDLLKKSDRQMADLRGNRVGMIFQEPMTSLNPSFTIGNQMEEMMLRHRRVSRNEARERATYLLQKVGIVGAERRLKQYPHQLSGGLRQRVMIAMTLMCGPDLIIADEPTTALDVTIQAQILLLLAELQREFGMALILITHDLGIVARVADRLAVMYAGQIVEQGNVEDVFGEPLHPYTRGLLSCIPVPGKTERGAHLGSIPGIVPSMIGDIEGCHFRDRCPHAWMDCAKGGVDLRALDQLRAYRCLMSPSDSVARATELEMAE